MVHVALEKWANDSDRLSSVVERCAESLPLLAQADSQVLHFSPGRHEDGDTSLFLDDVPDETIVEKGVRLEREHLNGGSESRVERLGVQNIGTAEVAGVEAGINRRAEPDEPASRTFAEGQAKLELGRGLMDLIDDNGVPAGDKPVLEPAAGDSGRDDDHVPPGRFRGRFALAIHDTDPQRLGENRLCDRAYAECLADPGPGDDAKPLPAGGPGPKLFAMLSLEHGLDPEPEGKLDRLTGCARGCDHDDPASRVRGCAIRLGIGREQVISGGLHRREDRSDESDGEWPADNRMPPHVRRHSETTTRIGEI